MVYLVAVVLAGAALGMLEMWREVLPVIVMVLLHAMLVRGVDTIVALPVECHGLEGLGEVLYALRPSASIDARRQTS